MSASMFVNTQSDDDFIGFAFGFQNTRNFYLLSWKQKSQSYWRSRPDFLSTAKTGIELKVEPLTLFRVAISFSMSKTAAEIIDYVSNICSKLFNYVPFFLSVHTIVDRTRVRHASSVVAFG